MAPFFCSIWGYRFTNEKEGPVNAVGRVRFPRRSEDDEVQSVSCGCEPPPCDDAMTSRPI